MRRIVLAGGGHAHALALVPLCRAMGKDAQVVMVSPNRLTPYSGMIPGTIEAIYTRGELQIDLQDLAARAGARLVRQEAIGLDPARRLLRTGSGELLPYDVLSLNIGAPMRRILQPSEDVAYVKPVDPFLDWIERLDAEGRESVELCVVGAGAAGVEVACALHRRFRRISEGRAFDFRIALLEAGPRILAGYPDSLAGKVVRELAAMGINVCVNFRAESHSGGEIVASGGNRLRADKVVVAAPVRAPDALGGMPLELNATGFVAVNRFLQAATHPDMFACGDVCDVRGMNYPKAGVFAVRQAGVLAHNIAAACRSQKMREFPPRKRYLSIISLGAKRAIASYGKWFWLGRWVWLWKNRLDKSFMNRLAEARA